MKNGNGTSKSQQMVLNVVKEKDAEESTIYEILKENC